MRGAAVLLLVGLLAGAAAGLAWAGLGQEEPEARRGQSVNICHAAGNGKYVSNSPDVDSIISGEGHGGHPEDIISPFDYEPKGDETGHYPGQNWNEEGRRSTRTAASLPTRRTLPTHPSRTAASQMSRRPIRVAIRRTSSSRARASTSGLGASHPTLRDLHRNAGRGGRRCEW